MTVFEKVQEITVEQLGVDIEEVTLEANLVEDLGADSLDIVELVMAFEEEFNIEIDDSSADSLKTVKDITEYIKKEQL